MLGERLDPLLTRAAFAAVQVATFIASPRQVKRHADLAAALGDVALIHRDERPQQFDRPPVAKLHGFVEGVGELGAAVGINRVVAAVGRVSDGVELRTDRPRGGDAEHDHVAVRHDRLLHAFRFVMPMRHRRAARREGAVRRAAA